MSTDHLRDAVVATGGLAIHSDLGGVLCVLPDGRVSSYGLLDGRAAIVEDIHWVRFALKRAGEKFPQLAPLIPARPVDARNCLSCASTGFLQTYGMHCAKCFGQGWFEATDLPDGAPCPFD